MSTTTATPQSPEIDYPDSDGEPMSENTLQFKWIVTIKEGLDNVFRDDPDVFVAGDLLWYPVEGDPKTRMAPDTMVAFGRPKGYRGSYKQWEEGGIAPQVVFEILSPGNRPPEMANKFAFYDRFGVEEYYIYDPEDGRLSGWLRQGGRLEAIPEMRGHVSPRLRVRFEPGEGPDNLTIVGPDGEPLLTYGEIAEQRDDARHQAEAARNQAEAARNQAEAARNQAEAAGTRPRRPSGGRPWRKSAPSVSPRGSASLALNRNKTESASGRSPGRLLREKCFELGDLGIHVAGPRSSRSGTQAGAGPPRRTAATTRPRARGRWDRRARRFRWRPSGRPGRRRP